MIIQNFMSTLQQQLKRKILNIHYSPHKKDSITFFFLITVIFL